MTEKLLPPKEAAKVMGISYRALLDMLPQMPCIQVGKRFFLTESLIEQWRRTSWIIPAEQKRVKKKTTKPPALLPSVNGRIPRRAYKNVV